jgi:hypothetical protein
MAKWISHATIRLFTMRLKAAPPATTVAAR